MEDIDLSYIEVDETIILDNKNYCPICNREMIGADMSPTYSYFYCKNGCYAFNIYKEIVNDFIVFDHRVFFQENRDDKVRRLIQYYKENDRYLAEILERR